MSEPKEYEGVRAASKSSIEIDFYYRDKRCKERLKLKPSPANLRKASNHRGAVLSSIEAGTFDYGTTFPNSKRRHQFRSMGQNLSSGDYLSSWFNQNLAGYKSSTYADHERTFNNQIIPALGDIPIIDLCLADVRDWTNTLTCGLKRVRNILGPLRAALDDAVTDEHIGKNPITGWKVKRKEGPKKEDVIPFTREEQAAILSAASGQEKNFIQFAFWSGLRTSELAALTWDDIDFENDIFE